jgi:hypothetical protein
MSDEPTSLYCAFHPNRETSLRCNRCEKPICSKCAIQTPTGYRCPECIRGQQKTFDTARWSDYPITFITAAFLSFLGSLIAANLGFFTIFIAPIAGTIIAEIIRFVIRRRRAKRLYQVATAGVLIGSVPLLLSNGISALVILATSGLNGIGTLFPLLWLGLYASLVTSTFYYRLSGLVLGR